MKDQLVISSHVEGEGEGEGGGGEFVIIKHKESTLAIWFFSVIKLFLSLPGFA